MDSGGQLPLQAPGGNCGTVSKKKVVEVFRAPADLSDSVHLDEVDLWEWRDDSSALRVQYFVRSDSPDTTPPSGLKK